MKYMWIVFALLAAVSAAGVIILTKIGLKDLDSSLVFAIQSVLILSISWAVILYQGNWSELITIERGTWIILILAGVLTTLSTLFSYRALKLGEASFVTSLERLSVVFAVIFAYIFLKERLTWQSVIGVIMMISGAILIAMTEKADA